MITPVCSPSPFAIPRYTWIFSTKQVMQKLTLKMWLSLKYSCGCFYSCLAPLEQECACRGAQTVHCSCCSKQSSMQWHQQTGGIWCSQLEDKIIWQISLSSSPGSEEGTGVGGMGESNPGVGSSTWQGNVCITFASQTSVTSKLYLQGIPA